MSQEPDYWELSTATVDRLFSDQVDTLVRMKYFTGWQANGGRAMPGSRPRSASCTSTWPPSRGR